MLRRSHLFVLQLKGQVSETSTNVPLQLFIKKFLDVYPRKELNFVFKIGMYSMWLSAISYPFLYALLVGNLKLIRWLEHK